MTARMKPSGIALDWAGNIHISDGFQVRLIDGSTGRITTVAGTGHDGRAGDSSPAIAAQLSSPTGLAVQTVDSTKGTGNLYIADYDNLRARKGGS